MSYTNHLSPSSTLSFRWECPLTQTGKRSAHSTCAKEFAKELGFQLIESSDDGNCFFYTLTEFGRRSKYAPLQLERNRDDNAMALRQQLVQHIQDNLYMYEPFLANNNEAGTVNEQIEELRENGAWASSAGDLVPMAGPNAFGIHINMYNIENGGDYDYISLIPFRSEQPTNVYVSIMRVREGHFQLLWPRSGVFQRGSPPRNAGLSGSNVHSDEKEVLDAVKVSVKAAQHAVQVAKKVLAPSRSIQSEERKLNQIAQNLGNLSLGGPARRSTRSTRATRSQASHRSPPANSRPSRSSRSSRASYTRKNKSPLPSLSPPSSRHGSYENNNNDLRRAIEASLQHQ